MASVDPTPKTNGSVDRSETGAVTLALLHNDMNWIKGIGATGFVLILTFLVWFFADVRGGIKDQTDVIRRESQNSVAALRNDLERSQLETQKREDARDRRLDEILKRLPAAK